MPAMETQYEPGKKLHCICGRSFKTERGLKQHIRRTRKGVVMSVETGKNTGTQHGRCWSPTFKLLHKYMMKDLEASLNFYSQFRKSVNLP